MQIPPEKGAKWRTIKGKIGINEPSEPKSHTPILVSDDQGITLRKHSPGGQLPCILWAEECAATERLVDIVQERIEGALKQHGPLQIYFWAGTYDVIKQVEEKVELRYPDDTEECVRVIGDQYRRLQSIVSEYPNLRLKFVELPYITLSKWNGCDMLITDKNASEQITRINLLIRQLNRDSSVNTLHFGSGYLRCRKRKGKKPRYSVNPKFSEDGVHPTLDVSIKLVRSLQWDIYNTCYGDAVVSYNMCKLDDIQGQPGENLGQQDDNDDQEEDIGIPDDITADQQDDTMGQLDDVEIQLHDIVGQPDDIVGLPDDIESQPDDVENQPDDVESQPDDVESQPDDVESQPDDVEDLTDDITNRPDELDLPKEDKVKSFFRMKSDNWQTCDYMY